MKILLSIFCITLTLTSEVLSLIDCHACEWVKSEACTAENLEGCEMQTSNAKINHQNKRDRSPLLVCVKQIYRPQDPKNNLINRFYHQHQFKKHTSPIYLSNQVFLI